MRFKDFYNQYQYTNIKNVSKLITKGTTPKDFISEGIKFIKIDCIIGTIIDNCKVAYISDKVHFNELKRSILKENDILLAIAGATVGKHCIVKKHNLPANTNQALAIIRCSSKVNPYYILQLFDTNLIPNYIRKNCAASAQPNLNLKQVGSLSISLPSIKEQNKIVELFEKLNNRIFTQSKIIEENKKFKKQISNILFSKTNMNSFKKLGDLCTITTGKKDANAMIANGKYKFFTCAKDDFLIDTYSFCGKALLISGNGEIGLIKYYDGKFDAYQRTYVLQKFSLNILFVKYYLEYTLPRIVYKEKNVGAMPYIVLSSLSNIKIPILNNNEIENIVLLLNSIEKKINTEEKLLDKYKEQKKYLLSNMFI